MKNFFSYIFQKLLKTKNAIIPIFKGLTIEIMTFHIYPAVIMCHLFIF